MSPSDRLAEFIDERCRRYLTVPSYRVSLEQERPDFALGYSVA